MERYFIYVLELEQEKIYVGRSDVWMEPQEILEHHQSNHGPPWTKLYKPKRGLDRTDTTNLSDVDVKVKEYMAKYGIDNVRGGSYSEIDLMPAAKEMLHVELQSPSRPKDVPLSQQAAVKHEMQQSAQPMASPSQCDNSVVGLSPQAVLPLPAELGLSPAEFVQQQRVMMDLEKQRDECRIVKVKQPKTGGLNLGTYADKTWSGKADECTNESKKDLVAFIQAQVKKGVAEELNSINKKRSAYEPDSSQQYEKRAKAMGGATKAKKKDTSGQPLRGPNTRNTMRWTAG